MELQIQFNNENITQKTDYPYVHILTTQHGRKCLLNYNIYITNDESNMNVPFFIGLFNSIEFKVALDMFSYCTYFDLYKLWKITFSNLAFKVKESQLIRQINVIF